MAEVTLTISAEDSASGVLTKVAQGLDKLTKQNAEAGASSRKAGEDAKTGGKGFDQFAHSLNIAAGNLKDLLTPANLVGSVIGVGMVMALRNAISETHHFAMEMQRLTLVTGASLSEIGELQDAASKLGVGAGTLQRAFFLLSSEIESGGRNMAKLGISVRDAMGRQRGDIELLKLMSAEFRKMSSATEQAVAAKKAFGRSAVSLLPVLTLTEQQIEELGESGREFNKRFGEDGVKAAIRLGGAVDEVKEAFMRMHITMISDITPGIKMLADNFAHLVDIVWYIPKPIRLVVETFAAMLLVIGGAVLAIKTLAGAFAAFFVALQIPALASLAAGIGSLAVPIAAVLAVLTGLLVLGPHIKDFFASMIPQGVIDKWERFKISVSATWEKLKEMVRSKPTDVYVDEGARALSREGAETGDREQTLAELQIEMGLKNRLLQTEMQLIRATKDSVTAELQASRVKQQLAMDEINLELKKLSARGDADPQILAERAKLEQAKTNILKAGEAERERILGQQASARLQQATAVDQQYRAIRLSEQELEQTIALNSVEMAKTANRQMLEDFKITQDEMVRREVSLVQEELEIKLNYLQKVRDASEQKALEDKRLVEAQAKATGEAAKDTALKINKIDADLAAARTENAAKVAQANLDAENKIAAAIRITAAATAKLTEEDRKRNEALKVRKQLFDAFSLEASVKKTDQDKAEIDATISDTRAVLQLEQERFNLLVALKRLDPAKVHLLMNKELQQQITILEESKRLYEKQPELVKQIDMEILRLTDRIYTMRDALTDAFGGISDILSILGVKVGKFILMLQQLPRVLSGFEKFGKSIGTIVSLLTSASPAAASQGEGQASGLFGMLGQLGGFLGMGNNPAAAAAGGGTNLFGMTSAAGNPGGFSLFGMGGGQAGSMMSQILGMLGPAMMSAGIGYALGSMIFGKSGGIGAGIGAGIGSLFGPLGAIGGGLLGGGLGKLFGGLFGSTPKAKLKAKILPFDLDELTSGGLRDLDTAVRGTRVGAISVNVRGNVYKTSKEHKLEEEFARALNDLFIDMMKGIKKLIPQLPKVVGAELDAALESLSETGLEFEKFSKSGSKAKKKLKKHLANLPNAMIEAVVEELGFGKLDLKLMGGGDAAKGFEGLLGALGGLSAVLKRVNGSADTFTGTLEEFTDRSIEFFEQFRRGGETFSETVERVNQGFAQLFGVTDQLSLDVGMATQSGMQGMVDAYRHSVQQMTDASDQLTIAVESGASPDEVAAMAQAVRDAMDVSMNVLAQIQQRLDAINAAIVTGVDLYADLEVRILALGGAATAIDELVSAAERLAAVTENIGARISIFESLLSVVGTSFDAFTAALPKLARTFGDLMIAIRGTANNSEAITQLQALAQAVVNGAQSILQGIADAANKAREAAQSASDSRIAALEREREAIQTIADEQKEALQAQLDALRQWTSIAQSAKAQLVDLFNLLASTHPETSFNEILAQFRSAVSGFGPGSSPEAATNIQELARQVLQLAQGVPGMDLPSAAFQALAAEVKAALEAVKTVADNQPSEEELLEQIAHSGNDQSARLAEIDAAIRAEQERLKQTLQSISAQERAQIEAVNAQQAAALTQIREHLGERLTALRIEQEAAREVLKQITGELTWEQFIAEKQSESVSMLQQIRDVLKEYLGSLLEHFGEAVSNGGDDNSGSSSERTVAQILTDAGYSKKKQRNMTLVDAQKILGFSGSAWTELLFPLGFELETTLEEFFKRVYGNSNMDHTLSEIGDRLRELLASIPGMASGGIVPSRPGGTLVRVGEAGYDEAIVPLRRSKTELGAGTGGEVSITINVAANGDVNAKKLADQLEEELMERVRYGRLSYALKGGR